MSEMDTGSEGKGAVSAFLAFGNFFGMDGESIRLTGPETEESREMAAAPSTQP